MHCAGGNCECASGVAYNGEIMENLSQKIAQRRREYISHPLDESIVDADPVRQFHLWFDEAVHAEQPDPEAMTLATVGAEGRVSARVVLLKGCDERGFVFYTNYESRKSTELTGRSWAALTFYWMTLNRQVRIEGRVERAPDDEADAYFATRPRGSQLGAWASPQSRVISGRAELESRMEEIERRFRDRIVPRPANWGGFLVHPESIEFWQGRESRLHDRIFYTRTEDGAWRIERLAP